MVVAWNHGRSSVVIFSWSCRPTDVWCNDVCIKLNSMQRENRYFCISLSTIGLCQSIENWMRIHACIDKENWTGFKTISQRIALCNIVKKRNTYHLDDKYETGFTPPRPTKTPRIEPFSQRQLDNENITRKQIIEWHLFDHIMSSR